MENRALTIVFRDRLLLHNVLVGGSTLLAGVLGFAFQALISHRLHPSDYAAVFGAMTLLTLVTVPASALTLLMARESSRDRALAHHARSTAMLRDGNYTLLGCGIVLGLLVAAGAPWISSFLNARPSYSLGVAASLPVALALPLVLGELQGEERFFAFSALIAGQAALKLVAAIVIGTLLGPIGVVVGLAVAATVAYAAAYWLVRRKLQNKVRETWIRPALSYLVLVVPSTVALAVVLSADVLLVNHFFPKGIAGEYAAVAALGRAIFWAASAVAIVLFPKVVFKESQGGSGNRIIVLSLSLVVLGGATALLVMSATAGLVLSAFAGTAYLGGAAYLPAYAVAMTLLGTASVLIATHQSRADRRFLAILVPVAFAEPLGIALFHRDLAQVVAVLNLAAAALVIGLGALLLGRRQSGFAASAAGVATLSVPAEVNA